MKSFFQSTIALITFVVSVASYAESPTDVLFESLGGKAGISKIVDDLLDVWHSDPRINAKLQDVDVEHLRAQLKDQIAQLTGGAVVYKGKDMKTIHDGLDIRNVDFNALVEDLQQAMNKNGIPSRAQNKLLAKLAPMQRDVVTK